MIKTSSEIARICSELVHLLSHCITCCHREKQNLNHHALLTNGKSRPQDCLSNWLQAKEAVSHSSKGEDPLHSAPCALHQEVQPFKAVNLI